MLFQKSSTSAPASLQKKEDGHCQFLKAGKKNGSYCQNTSEHALMQVERYPRKKHDLLPERSKTKKRYKKENRLLKTDSFGTDVLQSKF